MFAEPKVETKKFNQMPKMGFNEWLMSVKRQKVDGDKEILKPICVLPDFKAQIAQKTDVIAAQEQQNDDSEEDVIMDEEMQTEYDAIKYWPKVQKTRRFNHQKGQFMFGALEG